MPMRLSRADARRAAMACRSLAHINRTDAERIGNPQSREMKVREVEALEKLAVRFDAHAESKPEPPAKP